MVVNVLFVDGKYRRRGPTAEKVFKTDHRINPRAAGLSENSKKRLKAADFAWADIVVCMERKYVPRIKIMFPNIDEFPPLEVINVSDDYIFMAPKLVSLLKEAMDEVLETYYADRAAAKADRAAAEASGEASVEE